MNTLFWVACIVAIVIAGDAYHKYLKMKERQMDKDPELEASLARIAELEERIRVLERIVTENKYDLGQEIERL